MGVVGFDKSVCERGVFSSDLFVACFVVGRGRLSGVMWWSFGLRTLYVSRVVVVGTNRLPTACKGFGTVFSLLFVRAQLHVFGLNHAAPRLSGRFFLYCAHFTTDREIIDGCLCCFRILFYSDCSPTAKYCVFYTSLFLSPAGFGCVVRRVFLQRWGQQSVQGVRRLLHFSLHSVRANEVHYSIFHFLSSVSNPLRIPM